MFVHLELDACTKQLSDLCDSFMYNYRMCETNARQRQLTVTTRDKRQTMLTFKVTKILLNNS